MQFTFTGESKKPIMSKSILFLLLIAACASAPEKELKNFSDSHSACRIDAKDINLSIMENSQNTLSRGIKTSGSLMFTTVGFVTDVAIIGAGIITLAWLCGDVFAVDCIDAVDLVEGDYKGVGNWTFDKTEKWRCPYVDHISKAVRESAECNYKHELFIEAFEQMNFLERDKVMRGCTTTLEREEVTNQLSKMKDL